MVFTLFSRILPSEIANIIFDYVKLQKTKQIYWEKIYCPSSLIIKNLIKTYSDYNTKFKSIIYIKDELKIIIETTNKLAIKGLIKKNIYKYMDEYIDNLFTLKKHIEFHFKDSKQIILCNQSIIQNLNKFLD